MHYRPEEPADAAAIEALLDAAFGPERFRKTAYKLRAGLRPIPELSLVLADSADPGAVRDQDPAGAIRAVLRFWPLLLGEARLPGLLAGPLAVTPSLRGQGYGGALMREGLRRAEQAGHSRVVLIGDPPYYRRFGFRSEPVAGLTLPAPEEPGRFQGLALHSGAFDGLSGPVRPALADETDPAAPTDGPAAQP